MILSEHIEDCEHAHIQTKILNFLAQEGPLARNPSSYIRFIYNRVNLEKAVIRAAAVSSLAAFAHKVPALRQSILLLLKKCLNDSDDEVRERAQFYIRIFEMQEGNEAAAEEKSQFEDMKSFLFDEEQTIDVNALETYINENREQLAANEDGFEIDLSTMTTTAASKDLTAPKKTADNQPQAQAQQPKAGAAKQEAQKSGEDAFDLAMKEVSAIAEFLKNAKHQFSSQVVQINEGTAEYIVSVKKHFYDKFIIVQYGIKNTLEDQKLSKVNLKVQSFTTEQNIKVAGLVPIADEDSIAFNE